MLNIFISDLGRYNAGELTGKWYDMESEEGREEAAQAVADIIENGSGEYFISDYESDWADISASIGGLDEIIEVMAQVDELDESDKEVFKAIYSLESYDMDDILRIVEDGDYTLVEVDNNAYLSAWEELAWYLVHEAQVYGNLTDNPIIDYVDLNQLGDTLRHDYMDYVEVQGALIFLSY